VVFADNLLFSCSSDSLEGITEAIKEHKLNRVIVASCSPRTHEPLFRETLRRAGLNPYLFEMANIRDQCSWVHQGDHEAATEKAKDLIRMALARAVMLKPLHQLTVKVDQRGLVIGGGAAGLTAALSLADQGFETTLVEKTDKLGGLALRLDKTTTGQDIPEYVQGLISRAESHPKLTILKEAQVTGVSGAVGRFTAKVKAGGKTQELGCGAVILAVGGGEYQPTEYLAENENVTTQLVFGEELKAGDNLPDSVVMIQCVGSREEEHPYCSRVCCTKACLNALALKEKNPQAQVTILYRDIRTYSTKEKVYREARQAGVRFIRFEPEDKPEVMEAQGRLMVSVFDQALRERLLIPADKVVLSAAVRPDEAAHQVASRLKLPLDADGFFMEAHLKLRPVDFASQGFFLAGLAHGPKFIDEAVAQAKGAAARAAAELAQEERQVGGEVSVIDPEHCVRCLTCLRSCPFDVPAVGEDNFPFIDPAACQGCGVCVSACPRSTITLGHHTDDQIVAKEMALS
jgi:heterodisulfide reductase subunit A-like polyferredoxin